MGTNCTPNWSELVPDVWSLVFNHLSFTDFSRAKTVCTSWYVASRSSSPRRNQIPWLILYEDLYWKLFNPEEGKFYRTQNLGWFAECRAVATCGSWVLVFDKQVNFYILNPFTLESIHLPPLESNRSAEFMRRGNYSFDIRYSTGNGRDAIVETAVLWIDEKTKEYLVVWSHKEAGCWPSDYVCFCREGDKEWFQVPSRYESLCGCKDLAYKDKKLYILTYNGCIRILDFSLGNGLPTDIPDGDNPYAHRPFLPKFIVPARVGMRLTTSGDVLLVQRVILAGEKLRFQVYKMSSTIEKREAEEAHIWEFYTSKTDYWKRVHCLEEEEALVWDLSVTLPTKGISGIKQDSIYYSHTSESSIREVAAYEIPTHEIAAYQMIQPFRHRDRLLGDARWFVPSAAGE